MTKKSTAQESSKENYGLLSAEERGIFSQIATKEPPYSQRAQALLALGDGASQTEAARQSGLTARQVRYWFAKFRRDGTNIFPGELLNQEQPATQTDVSNVQEIEQNQDGENTQAKSPTEKETNRPVDDETAQAENMSKTKKSKKKAKKGKGPKKGKKSKKSKKAKKTKKTKKKAKKNKTQKGKSGKKKRKDR